MSSQDEFVIDVQDLSKNFDGNLAVNQVSLQLKKGEIFGFLGPNGSGKTTTIRMICGLLTPDSGKGQCLGYNIITDSYDIKCNVGYMPQRFSLYEDLSIYENLDFIAQIYQIKNRKTAVEQSLEELGLVQQQKKLAGTLSGGWKQRLSLAAALLHKPQLLLLDEPTAGVDPSARREFWNHIHNLGSKGITALVSTHYMDEAERCNRLAYIIKGKILIRGTASEIINKSNLFSWQITGQNLVPLAKELENLPGIEQVITLGDTLRVSGSHKELIAKTLTEFKSDLTWTPITPNLEDVFVHLVTE